MGSGGAGGGGGDKGKSQQKVLVFASGIRKVFGHPFNWGEGRGAEGGQGRLQWGPGGWGGVTCWVPAATKLTPPVSPVTGGRHHVSPDANAGLQDGWAPFLGPASSSPPGRDAPGASARAPWMAGGGQQRAEASQPGSQFRSGGGATASGPAPKGPAGPSCGSGGACEGLVSSGGGWQLQFLRPGQGGWA